MGKEIKANVFVGKIIMIMSKSRHQIEGGAAIDENRFNKYTPQYIPRTSTDHDDKDNADQKSINSCDDGSGRPYNFKTFGPPKEGRKKLRMEMRSSSLL